MPKIAYVPRHFSAGSLAIIDQANEIIEDYQAQGFTLTLRQLYYQFVARDLIPNKQTEYKRLGSIINDARLAGLIDWEAIEDRTRNVRKNAHFDSPEDIVRAAMQQYHRDLWADQTYRPEVWIEKDALVGVIESVCAELDVPYFACRGYSSQSEQWRAGMRAANHEENEQHTVILHLGDHDPSGIDMTRDNDDRLDTFCQVTGGVVTVKRLALNMDQVKKYRPPPNPAKMTDSRFGGYADKYGNKSWELDALDPAVIANLVRDAILALRDEDKYQRALTEQETEREALQAIADRWEEVALYLRGRR